MNLVAGTCCVKWHYSDFDSRDAAKFFQPWNCADM